MREKLGIMVLLSLLLLVAACSNAKEVQNTIDANQSATFTVTGLECCPPSVVQSLIQKVDGVSKVDIEPSGSTGKVTVSFDDKKTNLKEIKTSVSKYGFGVTGG